MTNYHFPEASSLRRFVDEYFESWGKGVPEKVLAYFSEDVVIHLRSDAGTLAGKEMVGKQWVIPTLKTFPGNVHRIINFLEAGDQIAVEWVFTALNASTGKETHIEGCSLYWVSQNLIRRGHVYIYSPRVKRERDLPTLDHAHPAADRLLQEIRVGQFL